MTLSDYLKYTRTYILKDAVKPYFWSDEVVVARLNEALNRVATRTHSFVVDDREISMEVGEDTYDLDDDIVFVNAVTIDVDGKPIRLAPSTEGWTPDASDKARPTRYTLDRASGVIRFHSTPDAIYTATLRVARLPAELTVDDLDSTVEVDRKYQLAPADWVAFRCFNDPDSDGFNPGGADRAEMRFNKTINEAKRDTYRLRTGNTMRVHGQRVK